MATAVQIELMVDEKGAVTGVRNFSGSIKSATAGVQQLNAELSRTSAQAAGMKSLERGFTAGEGSIRTMNAELRSLQGSIFGDTRAATEFLATLPAVADAMELAFPIFGATALIGVLGLGIQKIGEFNDKYFSLTAAARDYNVEVEKAKKQDFGNAHSIETATARIDEATVAAQKLNDASQALGSGFWGQLLSGNFTAAVATRTAATSFAEGSVDAKKQVDALTPKQRADRHEINLQTIESTHALDGRLQGEKKITAELAKRKEIAGENRRYSDQEDRAQGNTTPSDSGATVEGLANKIAQREAEVETFNLEREHAIELRHLREQAAQAQLRGSALYVAQETAAIEDLKDKDLDSVAARQAVYVRFHAEELRRIEEERDAVAKRAREAGGAGLSGIAKIRYEGQSRDQDILADEAGGKYQRFGDALTDHASNATKTNAEILASEQSFTQRVDQLADESASHQISGFARIRAEGQKQIAALRQEFEKTYGKDASNPDYAAHVGELNRGTGIIDSGARDQEVELARRNSDETAQIEAQARIRSMSAEKQRTAAIEEEYNERLRKYQEQLAQQEISQDDYNRRVKAAQTEMNADLDAAAREEREKLAGELQGLFSAHPLEALQRMGEKYAAQSGAALIQRVSSGTGHGLPNPGGWFDKLAGTPHSTRDRQIEAPATTGGYGSMMALQSATIYVTRASFVGGGGTGATRSSGGGFSESGSGVSGGGFSGGGWSGGGGAGGGSSSTYGLTPSGAPPAPGAGFGGFLNDMNAGVGTARGISGLFHSGGGSSSAQSVLANAAQPSGLDTGAASGTDGGGDIAASPGTSAFSSSVLGGGLTKSNTLGVAGSALGLFGAYKQGGVGGIMSGAMSGAKLGMDIGGPIGAGIGAVGGAVLGLFGGNEPARVWWLKQGRPRLSNDMDAFNQGSMDYLAAYMDIEQLKTDAHNTLSKMGLAGSRYYHDTVTHETDAAEQKLTREQKAGRSAYGMSSASYDVGSPYVPADQIAQVHQGERIFTADHNERMVRAFEQGSAVHASYRDAMQSPAARVAAPASAPGPELHLHAIDAKSSVQFLTDNADAVRAAYNKSFGNYGGSADGAN